VLMVRPLSSHSTLSKRLTPRRVGNRLSTHVLRSLGKELAVKLCGVLHAMARAIEQQQQQHSLTTINKETAA